MTAKAYGKGIPKSGEWKDGRATVPQVQRSIEIACKRLSGRALAILERALDEVKTPELEYKQRILAAKEILDRGWGKPRQQIDSTVVTGSGEQFLEALRMARERAEIERTVIDEIMPEPESEALH